MDDSESMITLNDSFKGFQMHKIVDYANGDTGALELECEKGCETQNLINFDRFDWLDAASEGFKMRCPECGHLSDVQNDTP